jgi:hypothetical protein
MDLRLEAYYDVADTTRNKALWFWAASLRRRQLLAEVRRSLPLVQYASFLVYVRKVDLPVSYSDIGTSR